MNKGNHNKTTISTSGISKQDVEHHLSEVVGTLRKWHSMTPEEQAFARLSGEGYTPDVLDHMQRYVDAMQDHLTYGNPSWGVNTPKQ